VHLTKVLAELDARGVHSRPPRTGSTPRARPASWCSTSSGRSPSSSAA
jgi:hypothetical protein